MRQDPRVITVPVECCFWSIIDTSAIGGRWRRVTRRQIGYLFEAELPLDVEEICWTSVPIDRNTLVACGMSRAEAHARTDARTLRLVPAAIPSFIDDAVADRGARPPDPQRLNLLTHADSPPAVRRARQRAQLMLAALCVAVSAVLTTGALHRAAAYEAIEGDIIHRIDEAYEAVVPADGSSRPGHVRLLAALRTAEQRGRDVPPAAATDAGIVLERTLAGIPSIPLRLELLRATRTETQLDVLVVDHTDAESLRGALGGSLEIEDRGTRVIGTAVQSRLTLRPRGGGP